MDFLGMGPMELIVVLALALVVLGPEKMPEIFANLGKVFRDLRRLSAELSAEFNQSMEEVQSIQAEVKGIQDEVKEIGDISISLDKPEEPVVAAPVATPQPVAASVGAAVAKPAPQPSVDPQSSVAPQPPAERNHLEQAILSLQKPSTATTNGTASPTLSSLPAAAPAASVPNGHSAGRPTPDELIDELLPPY